MDSAIVAIHETTIETDSAIEAIGANYRSATAGDRRRKRVTYHKVQEWTTGVDLQNKEVRSSITI
jgi:hypothetical protein